MKRINDPSKYVKTLNGNYLYFEMIDYFM